MSDPVTKADVSRKLALKQQEITQHLSSLQSELKRNPLRGWIEEHPILGAGIVVGVGALVGYKLLKPKRSPAVHLLLNGEEIDVSHASSPELREAIRSQRPLIIRTEAPRPVKPSVIRGFVAGLIHTLARQGLSLAMGYLTDQQRGPASLPDGERSRRS